MIFHSRNLFWALVLFILSFLSSCSILPPRERKVLADSIAEASHFSPKMEKGGRFSLYTYQKISDPKAPIAIYIEGDGFIVYRDYISNDPTPVHPMLIRLAAMDDRPNVVYIARPCQYTIKENLGVCNSGYWTGKRMSEDSVEAVDDVIRKIAQNRKIDLIGFSGGGGIAVLVAARNHNVRSMITIAGNLDHVAFNKYHKTTPMAESLNPIDYVSSVRNIPQLHLSGTNDKAVPPFISENFEKAANSVCVHREVFPGFTHSKGWDSVWKSIISKEVNCRKGR
ncbi:MAG: alpha/beta hydrolase [Rickettsiaceae bacterium]|nr:alpha/beta hydrolase [Rickettsiaceae bacterium]